jgi:rsbT co-antagonist protein RsbR
MARQQRVLAELSTPVIQVYENILVIPLVGAIDSERARRIMEELLLGITQHQAELVIIDITGVPVVDTAVANHLMQTIKAARLLGTQSILVGISGEVAQALVHLQIDLSGVVTRSNLQAGIEYALERMGLEIVPKGEVPPAETQGEPAEGKDSRAQRGQEVSGWPVN